MLSQKDEVCSPIIVAASFIATSSTTTASDSVWISRKNKREICECVSSPNMVVFPHEMYARITSHGFVHQHAYVCQNFARSKYCFTC